MANPFSKAMMMARYAGKTYGKVKVLKFVRQQKSEEMRQAVWFVKALCGYCGKEYECRFDSVRYRTNPHCGCQSKRSMWNRTSEIKRQEGSEADKRRKARQKAEQSAKVEQELRKKEKERHEAEVRRGLYVDERPSRTAAIGNGIELSESRLKAIWEKMPEDQRCIAWQKPEAFIQWGLHNGYKSKHALVRIDESKPYHPLNVKWIK